MNKHEEARNKLLIVTNHLAKLFEDCPEEIGDLEDYINECEATEKAYEELKRNLMRFMEIFNIYDDSKLWQEHNELLDKLSKVTSK